MLRTLCRFSSRALPLSRTPSLLPRIFKRNVFIPLSTTPPPEDPSKKKECTLYIKGFLAKGELAEHFGDWQRGHNELSQTHNWGPVAHGYFWKSGDLLASLVPHATILAGAYHLLALKKLAFSPQVIALTAAAEALVMGGKFWYEFKKASDTAKAHAPSLAQHIQEISKDFTYVRVVAHSLGCALLLEALKVLPEEAKPDEIHFLAPAIDETYLFHDIAKEHAYVYHCGKDFALQTASALFFQQKEVVGLAGPTQTWRGLTPVDVSDHFGFFVHTNYRNVLGKIIVDHRKHYTMNEISVLDWHDPTGLMANHSVAVFPDTVAADPNREVLDWHEEWALIANADVEKQLLEKLESEIVFLEKQKQESESAKEGKSEGKEGKEGKTGEWEGKVIEIGKELLQGMRVVLENRRQILEQAKALASKLPLGKG